jgi:hypothetical protein
LFALAGGSPILSTGGKPYSARFALALSCFFFAIAYFAFAIFAFDSSSFKAIIYFIFNAICYYLSCCIYSWNAFPTSSALAVTASGLGNAFN